MRIHPASCIAFLLLEGCTSQPTAPATPTAHPTGDSTVAAAGTGASTGSTTQPRKAGRPELRYYVIGDA